MRTFWLGLRLLAAGVLLTAASARAQNFEGMRAFGIALWAPEGELLANEWAVGVTVWTLGGQPVEGQARISVVGAGMAIDGDGPRRIPPDQKGPLDHGWTLKLRGSGIGRVEVRGEVRFAGKTPRSYELHEALLVFEVLENGVRLVENRNVRQISVREGKKFRYAGSYLVAVDDDDDEDPRQVEARPQLVSGPIIQCGECGLLTPVEIPVVVTVGKSGKVTWVSAVGDLDGRPITGRLRSAIENGLAHFNFRPASSNGRPIADYASVNVKLAPQ